MLAQVNARAHHNSAGDHGGRQNPEREIIQSGIIREQETGQDAHSGGVQRHFPPIRNDRAGKNSGQRTDAQCINRCWQQAVRVFQMHELKQRNSRNIHKKRRDHPFPAGIHHHRGDRAAELQEQNREPRDENGKEGKHQQQQHFPVVWNQVNHLVAPHHRISGNVTGDQ